MMSRIATGKRATKTTILRWLNYLETNPAPSPARLMIVAQQPTRCSMMVVPVFVSSVRTTSSSLRVQQLQHRTNDRFFFFFRSSSSSSSSSSITNNTTATRRWMNTDDGPNWNPNNSGAQSFPPPPSLSSSSSSQQQQLQQHQQQQRNKTVGTFHAGAVMTGTVKFYLRDKGYGFIVADGRPDTDLFIHRANIVCTHSLSEAVLNATVRYPYLKQSERVRFILSHDMGTVKAVNVTWLNGDAIPPERKNYLGGVYERSNRMFGEVSMGIMKEKVDIRDPFTEAEYEKIRVAYIESKRSIEHAERVLLELGMDLHQFPTIKGNISMRGRYVFQHEVDNENRKAIASAIAAANNVQPTSTLSIASLIAKSANAASPVDNEINDINEAMDAMGSETEQGALFRSALFDEEATLNENHGAEIDDDIYDDATPYKRR